MNPFRFTRATAFKTMTKQPNKDKDAIEIASRIGRGELIAKDSITQYNRYDTDYRGVNGSRTPLGEQPLDADEDAGG